MEPKPDGVYDELVMAVNQQKGVRGEWERV